MFSLKYCLQNFHLDEYTIFEDKIINLLKESNDLYKLQCFENEQLIWELLIIAKVNGIFRHNEILILEDYKSKLIFVDLLQGIILNEKVGCYRIEKTISNNYLLYEQFENIRTPSLYDIKNFSKKWQLEMPVNFFLSKKLPVLLGFSKDINPQHLYNDHFTKFNLEFGKEEWSYDISDFAPFYDYSGKEKSVEVSKFIGIVNNVLWVGLTNGTILLIQIETGKKVAIIQHPFYRFGKNVNIFPDTQAMYIDEQVGVVIGCLMYQYWEVDIATYEVKHWDLTEHFEKENIYCSSGKSGEFVFDNDFVYFMGKDQCKVAALSRKDKNIVWQHKLVSDLDNRVMPRVMPMKIQLHNRYLFVQDSVKRLYVFEKAIAEIE